MGAWSHPVSLCLFCKNPVVHRHVPSVFKIIQTQNGEATEPLMLKTMHPSCMHRHRKLKSMRKKLEERKARLPPKKPKPNNVFFVHCEQCNKRLAIKKGTKNMNVSGLSEGTRIIETNPLRVVWRCRDILFCKRRKTISLRRKEENLLYLPHKIHVNANRHT
jgi:hypothetical protein